MNKIQIIPAEQSEAIMHSPKGKIHPLAAVALQLKPGESFTVTRAEWNWRSAGPSALINRLNKNPHIRYACFALSGKTGWLIKRTDNFGNLPAQNYLSSNKIYKTMAKKKEVMRTYNVSDAELIQITDALLVFAERDEAELSTRGINAAFRNQLAAKNNAFRVFVDDTEKKGDVSIEVALKDKAAKNCATLCSEIESFANRTFTTDTAEYRGFGFEGINELPEDSRIKAYGRVARRSEKHQAQLEPKGLTNAYLADFVTAIAQYDNALDNVADEKADRDITTQTRRIKGNEVHAGGKEISEAGKAYWIDKDEAKYNDYIFYDSINVTEGEDEKNEGNGENPGS